MKVRKIWDAADGSATPGRAFTASIGQENIVKEGEQLDYIMLGLKGAVSTAAVVIEDFADLLNPLTIKYAGDNRIVLTAQELAALSKWFFDEDPVIGENTDATGNDFLGNIKIPIFQKHEAGKDLTVQAERSAVTNIGTETIALTGYWDTGEANRKPIHCVRIQHTSAGSAGIETLGARIVPKGKLIGLIVSSPAASGFADGNIDVSVQRIKILQNGEEVVHFNSLADAKALCELDYVTPSVRGDLLRPFYAFDLRPMGLDAKANELVLQIDVQDVSDALVFMPVIEIA